MFSLYLKTLDFYTSYILITTSTILGLLFPILINKNSAGILNIAIIYLLSISLLIIRFLLTQRFPEFFIKNSTPAFVNPFTIFLIANTVCFQLFYPDFLLSLIQKYTAQVGILAFIIPLSLIPYYFISKHQKTPKKISIPLIFVASYFILSFLIRYNLFSINEIKNTSFLSHLGKFIIGSAPIFLLRLIFFTKQK
jgi:hypothetical protein